MPGGGGCAVGSLVGWGHCLADCEAGLECVLGPQLYEGFPSVQVHCSPGDGIHLIFVEAML